MKSEHRISLSDGTSAVVLIKADWKNLGMPHSTLSVDGIDIRRVEGGYSGELKPDESVKIDNLSPRQRLYPFSR